MISLVPRRPWPLAPEPDSYALVLWPDFWDRALVAGAAAAVVPGGLPGWEAFTAGARLARPSLPASWCLGPDEQACLLPEGFDVLAREDLPGAPASPRRRLLARPGGQSSRPVSVG
jgi:hypothetical protein